MTLKQAVQEVIKQNIGVNFIPHIFIDKTKDVDGEDLKNIIIGFLSSAENKKSILETLERYKGRPIFVEEFISMYCFDFSKEFLKEAMQRTKEIQQARFFYIFE